MGEENFIQKSESNQEHFRQSASRLGVRVGAHSLHGHDPDQEDIAVTAVKNHENYDSWTIENDICMLDLES